MALFSHFGRWLINFAIGLLGVILLASWTAATPLNAATPSQTLAAAAASAQQAAASHQEPNFYP